MNFWFYIICMASCVGLHECGHKIMFHVHHIKYWSGFYIDSWKDWGYKFVFDDKGFSFEQVQSIFWMGIILGMLPLIYTAFVLPLSEQLLLVGVYLIGCLHDFGMIIEMGKKHYNDKTNS